MKTKIKQDYDKEYDSLCINFGGNVKHSREFTNINVIFDFNDKDEIVGFEIEDFMEAVKKSDKKIDKIFKLRNKIFKLKKIEGKRK